MQASGKRGLTSTRDQRRRDEIDTATSAAAVGKRKRTTPRRRGLSLPPARAVLRASAPEHVCAPACVYVRGGSLLVVDLCMRLCYAEGGRGRGRQGRSRGWPAGAR